MNEAGQRAFAEAVEWARAELSRTDFGEVGMVFIVHGGRLTRVEKTVTVKEQTP